MNKFIAFAVSLILLMKFSWSCYDREHKRADSASCHFQLKTEAKDSVSNSAELAFLQKMELISQFYDFIHSDKKATTIFHDLPSLGSPVLPQ